jgi:hypothetical protein
MSMQVMKAQVQNGVYSERVINETTAIQPGLNGTPNHFESKEQDVVFSFQPECRTKASCIQIDAKPKNLTISVSTQVSIIAALRQLLPSGNLTAFRQSGLNPSPFTMSDGSKSLYRSRNITKTMHTTAHYMTVALRANDTILEIQNDPENRTHIPADYVAPRHRVVGTVFIQTTHLRVRWPWLALPAALVLVVAVLLFETIRKSRNEAVGVWKNNPLAVLMNTEWRPDRGQLGAATSDEIDEMAKQLEARVVHDSEDPQGCARRIVIRAKSSIDE